MAAIDDLILADSPAIYLDCQGSTVTDSSGYGRAITVSGGVVTQQSTDPGAPTAVGNSIRFDGAGGHLLLPDGGSWFKPADNGFSVEMWLRWRGGSNWQRVWDFANAASSSDMLFTPQNSSSQAQLELAGSATVAARSIPTGSWVHLTQTVTAAGQRTFFLNAGVMASGSGAPPTNGPRANMYVGRSQYSGDAYLGASMSRLAIYNKVLTPAQIRARYRAGQGNGMSITDPRDIPGLIAWYSAQEIPGVADGATLTNWPDRAGSRRDPIAVTGAPTYLATGGRDGGPCVEFKALGEAFTLPNILNGRSSGYILAGFWSTAGGNNVGGWEFGTNTQDTHLPYSNNQIYDDFGSTARRNNINPLLAMNSWHRLSFWSAPGDWGLRQNGQDVFVDAANTVQFPTAPRMGTAVGWQGGAIRLGYVVLLDHKPTQQEVDALEAYFETNPSGGIAAPRPITAAPMVTATGISNGLVLNWTGVLNADDFEYRIDGGAPVRTGVVYRAVASGLTNGQTYAVEMRGVNAGGAGPWSAPVAVTPTLTYLYDSYERPNSTASPGNPEQGGPYTAQAGTWGIQDGALYAVVSPTDAMLTFPAAVDFDATIKIRTPGTNQGFLFRYVDANNVWLMQMHASEFQLYRRLAGSWNTHGKPVGNAVAGDVMRVACLGPDIWIFRNGQLIMQAVDQQYQVASPTCGFRLSADSTGRFEEVVVTPITAPPLALVDAIVQDERMLFDPTSDTHLYKGRDTALADKGALA